MVRCRATTVQATTVPNSDLGVPPPPPVLQRLAKNQENWIHVRTHTTGVIMT